MKWFILGILAWVLLSLPLALIVGHWFKRYIAQTPPLNERFHDTDPASCPSCGASMQGEPIPTEHAHMYGGEGFFSRLVGIEYGYDTPEHYDGTSEWLCPFCGYREGRWSGKALADGEREARYGGARL